MVKKTLYVAAAVALLLGLFFGRDTFGLVKTGFGELRGKVRDSVPISLRIKQARNAIQDLEQPIKSAMETIAREEVAVAKLEKELTKCGTQLSKDRDYIFKLKNALDQNSGNIVLASRVYSPDDVKTALSREFEHYKSSEAKQEQLEKVMRARGNGLQAAREKLDAMLAARRQLQVDVENLEARLKMIEVAQTTSDLKVDDSQLSRTKELIEEINTRLDVAEKLLNTDTALLDRIPVDEAPADDNISDEITRYFSHEPEVESVAGH